LLLPARRHKFAKGLFWGVVADSRCYPSTAQQAELDKSLAEVREFLDQHLDPVATINRGYSQH
jgi:hypothetical protein